MKTILCISFISLLLLPNILVSQIWEKEGIVWEIKMEKDTFLVDEYISFEVKIKNNSGGTKKLPDLVSNFFRYRNLHNVKNNKPIPCYGGEASYVGIPCFNLENEDEYYQCIQLYCGDSDYESYSTVPYLEPGKYELKLNFLLTCPENGDNYNFINYSMFFNVIEPDNEENNIRVKLLDLRKFSNINKESTIRGLYQLWKENPRSVYRPAIYGEMRLFQMIFNYLWPNDIMSFEDLHYEAIDAYKNSKYFAYRLVNEEINHAINIEMKDIKLDKVAERKKRKEIKLNVSKMIEQKYPNTNFSKYVKSRSKYN